MGFFGKLFGAAASEPRPLTPINDLEQKLAALIDGSIPADAFVTTLLRSKVFVLLKGKPTPQDPPQPMIPFVRRSLNGFDGVCLFTAPERSETVQAEASGYESGLLVEFTWVLQILPEGLGIIINPGWDIMLEQLPEGVLSLRASLATDPPVPGQGNPQ